MNIKIENLKASREKRHISLEERAIRMTLASHNTIGSQKKTGTVTFKQYITVNPYHMPPQST